jgi:hypothetical protein
MVSRILRGRRAIMLYLGVSSVWTYIQYCHQGLPRFYMGKRVWAHSYEVDAWLRSRSTRVTGKGIGLQALAGTQNATSDPGASDE